MSEYPCLVVIRNFNMVHWMLWMLPFSHRLKNWVIPLISEISLDYIYNMIRCWRLLLFSWPPFREVCLNYEVVMFQPWTWTPPDLGSVANCYISILLWPAPPFSARHPMSTRGGYPLTPLPYLHFLTSCLHIGSFSHPGVICGVGGFVGRLISFSPIDWMCLIWFDMHLFSWIFFLTIYLPLQAFMTFTLLHLLVSCWLDMDSKNCWTVVGSFMPMLRIQKLVLFLAGNEWFHGLLYFDWEIYDRLWCSQYCATMPMGVTLGGKLTLNSNISYLMQGWSERSVFNVRRVEVFVPSISPEPGDHLLSNLLLCSSNFADEQYLSFLVCGYHNFIVALLFV